MQQQIPFPALTARAVHVMTDANYAFTIRDMYLLLSVECADPVTLVVPHHDDVLFPVGAQLDVLQAGDGKVSFVPDSGVEINSAGGNLSIASRSVGVSLIQRADNVWELIGDLIA